MMNNYHDIDTILTKIAIAIIIILWIIGLWIKYGT